MSLQTISRWMDFARSYWTMSLTSAAAGVLCLMVVVIIGGFTYIQHQYHELSEIREHARQLRIARQAIMDVDAYVLNALAVPKHKQDPFDYVRALDLLTRHEAQVPAAIAWQEKPIASSEFLAALKHNWHDATRLSENGELENAKQVYFERQTFDRVKATVNAIEQTLRTIESDFLDQNNAVNNATAILLLVQILTGAGCVLAFYQNARTSKRQAEIRAKAVVEAEASRVQVGKLFEMADMLQSASDYDDANAVLRSSATDLIFGFSGALYVSATHVIASFCPPTGNAKALTSYQSHCPSSNAGHSSAASSTSTGLTRASSAANTTRPMNTRSKFRCWPVAKF